MKHSCNHHQRHPQFHLLLGQMPSGSGGWQHEKVKYMHSCEREPGASTHLLGNCGGFGVGAQNLIGEHRVVER